MQVYKRLIEKTRVGREMSEKGIKRQLKLMDEPRIRSGYQLMTIERGVRGGKEAAAEWNRLTEEERREYLEKGKERELTAERVGEAVYADALRERIGLKKRRDIGWIREYMPTRPVTVEVGIASEVLNRIERGWTNRE